jgi:hypothetical protein
VEELDKIGGFDINEVLKDDYGTYLVPFDIKDYGVYFGGSAPEKPKNLKNGVPMNWDNENI